MADNYVALKITATDEAKPDLDDLQAKLAELQDRVATARADVDSAGADEQLADLQAKLDYVSKKVASPKIDLAGASRAAAQITAVEADLDELDAKAAESAAAVSASAGESEAAWGAMGAKAGMAILGIGVAMGYSAVKAAGFNSAMLTLQTQAGVSSSQIKMLGNGVLSLAGQVGFAPDSLVEALFHVESSFASVGISGPQALNLLKIAAQGAATGHANLVETTNALDATIVAGVPGIHSYAQAMGVLNATVGSGDMTMQDLADAMGSGVMAVAKVYGQNIYEVGAALAVLGDNNIRGAKAATDLRMAWQAMQAPMKTAAPVLQSIGLTMDQLGHTMATKGLSAGIDEFIQHMNASKVPMNEWGQYETEIFGKRAGVGIGILISQYARLESKFPDLTKSASGFGSAVAANNATAAQQWKNLEAGVEALTIKLGQAFLPIALQVVHALSGFANFLTRNTAAAYALAGVIAGVLSAAIGVKAVDAMKDLKEAGESVVHGVEKVIEWVGKMGAASGTEAGKAAAAQEESAGEAAAANEEAAGESSEAWTLAGHREGMAARQAALEQEEAAEESSASWLASAGEMIASAAAWVAENLAKVAIVVAENVAAAATTAAAWLAANAVMLLGIGAVIAVVVVAVYEIVKHWKTIAHAIAEVVSDVVNFVKSHWELLLEIMTGPIGLAVVFIKDHYRQILSIIDDAISWVRSHWPLLLAILTGPIGLAALFIIDHWHQILAGAQRMGDDVISFFRSLPGRILSAVGDLGNLLFGAGERVIEGLLHGITSMIGDIGSTMSSVVGEIKNFLPFSPAKKGPLSGSGDPTNSGRSIARMVAQGLTSGVPDITSAMEHVAGAVSPRGGYGGYAAGAGANSKLEVQLTFQGTLLKAMQAEVRNAGGDPLMFQKKVAYR